MSLGRCVVQWFIKLMILYSAWSCFLIASQVCIVLIMAIYSREGNLLNVHKRPRVLISEFQEVVLGLLNTIMLIK